MNVGFVCHFIILNPKETLMTLPTQMTAMTVQKYGKNPIIKTTIPMPNVGDDDVLVKVHSASVNPVDFKIRNGDLRLILPFKTPLILGNDLSGTVVAVGNNVHEFVLGDEVFGRIDKIRPNNQMGGTFAQFAVISKQNLAKKPANLDFNQSASLPLVALTAYQALTERMQATQGDKVLIHAGAGGLGSVAIQIAKNLGLYVATTVSPKGAKLVESFGVDEVIDYTKDDFSQKLTNFDFVLDTIGGETLLKSFQVVKKGGIVVSVSALPTAQFADEWHLPFYKKWLFALASAKICKTAQRYGAKYDFLFMRPSGEQLNVIKHWIENGQLTPIIDKIFAFDDTQQALEYQETGRAKGKIVIEVV